jgi:hypothetical protein
MGGRGSGGHNSKGTLRDVQCVRLDVHELARDGKLTLGKRGRLFGTIGFEVVGGPDAQRLVLGFPMRSASGERLDLIRQTICCYWRKAHYGGRYLMFSCSECGRSARVLYARHESRDYRIWFFMCRKCAGLTYQSTMGHRWDRSAFASRNCAPDSNGALTVPWLLSREACTSGHSNESWARSPTAGLSENRARATLEKTVQKSTAIICGGNVEAGVGRLVDGRSAIHQLGYVNRLAGHDSEKRAGESGVAAAREGSGQSLPDSPAAICESSGVPTFLLSCGAVCGLK